MFYNVVLIYLGDVFPSDFHEGVQLFNFLRILHDTGFFFNVDHTDIRCKNIFLHSFLNEIHIFHIFKYGLSFLEGCKCYNLSYPVDYGRKLKIISDCVLKSTSF